MNPHRLYYGRALLLALACAALTSTGAAEPIRLHPDNPHYYLYRGKPAILITSAEHYGAVINADFDYVKYLDALAAAGLNYTRIYPGFLIEPRDKFVKGNTLAPEPSGLLLPWARSGTPGYALGGNKFDLDRWDPRFFKRLRDFVAEAGKRGIVVQVCFFNAQYEDTWPLAALFHKNNVQGVGKSGHAVAQTLKDPELVRREDDYVREITRAVNRFDNVILEICDEPTLTGASGPDAGAWIAHMIDVIKAAERGLPKKHLIAQQLEEPVNGPVDFSAHPDVPVIVVQYVWQAGAQMGGMKALDLEYGHDKAIDFNETNYYPIWYKGDKIAASRVEGWEFIVGGGSSFNHLNGLFTVADPAGKSAENAQLLGALTSLKRFMYSFEFTKMRQDKKFISGALPAGAFARAISEPGRQYALYMHHSQLRGGSYEVKPGRYVDELTLTLPPGSYRQEWIDPATGRVMQTETIAHSGGSRTVTTPAYSADIALRMLRSDARTARGTR